MWIISARFHPDVSLHLVCDSYASVVPHTLTSRPFSESKTLETVYSLWMCDVWDVSQAFDELFVEEKLRRLLL